MKEIRDRMQRLYCRYQGTMPAGVIARRRLLTEARLNEIFDQEWADAAALLAEDLRRHGYDAIAVEAEELLSLDVSPNNGNNANNRREESWRSPFSNERIGE